MLIRSRRSGTVRLYSRKFFSSIGQGSGVEAALLDRSILRIADYVESECFLLGGLKFKSILINFSCARGAV